PADPHDVLDRLRRRSAGNALRARHRRERHVRQPRRGLVVADGGGAGPERDPDADAGHARRISVALARRVAAPPPLCDRAHRPPSRPQGRRAGAETRLRTRCRGRGGGAVTPETGRRVAPSRPGFRPLSIGVILAFAVTMGLSVLVPIYNDEVGWKIITTRFLLDGGTMISLFPRCD